MHQICYKKILNSSNLNPQKSILLVVQPANEHIEETYTAMVCFLSLSHSNLKKEINPRNYLFWACGNYEWD